MDPRVAHVARPTQAASPQTRIGVAAEMLRMGPYRALPVVESGPLGDGLSVVPSAARLVGLVTEGAIINAFFAAGDPEARARVREMPVSDIMVSPSRWVTPAMRTSEVSRMMDEAGVDTLPVVDAYFTFLGLVARSDLVSDLVRPFRPPVVGGMATPLGVYLTTGRVSGGAGTVALVTTGLVMFTFNLICLLLQDWLSRNLSALGPVEAAVSVLPHSLRGSLVEVFAAIIQLGLFLLFLRLSPISGYHAAEHQVVHALERAEPLFVENVRAMPRVHPRCGTNLVAGVFILTLVGMALQPFLSLGAYAFSAVVALAYWRTLGGWLQQNLTTRPATDAQIESGIRAARQLLDAHSRAPYAPNRPLTRIWRMGFLQILSGFTLGGLVLFLSAYAFPPLRPVLTPWLEAVMTM